MSTRSLKKFEMANAELAAMVRAAVREEIGTALESHLKPIKDDLKKIQRKVTDCDEKVCALEATANETENRLARLEESNVELFKENKLLKSRAESLERHSRKCNLRILGLSPDVERGNPTAFVNTLLCDLFGKETFGLIPPVTVAHRTGKLSEKPRCMIAKLYSSEMKQSVLRLAGEKKKEPDGLRYQGVKINLVPDITTEEWKQRSQFNGVLELLRETELRFGIAHPAKLLITFNNKTESFTDAEKAMEFYETDIKPTLVLPPT